MNTSSEVKSTRYSQPSDEQLLSEAAAGNHQAFGDLCLRYSGLLKQRILRIVRHPEDAEDILQETFLKAYQHLETFRGASRFSTWLVAIGTNMSLMLLRRRKTRRENPCEIVSEDGEALVMEWRDPGPDPEQRYMMYQTSQRVDRAVRRLSPQARNLFEMYYRNEVRLKDAARLFGISEATTKSRLLRARRKLQRSLKQDDRTPRKRKLCLPHE